MKTLTKKIKIKDFYIGENEPLCVITGPCVIEDEDHALFSAEKLKKIFLNKGINFIFKASYDKANRSSISSFRGPGLDKGLRILEKVKKELDLPVVSDIHLPNDVSSASEVLDILQIPAFLCRQTDLLVKASKTGLCIHVKKGQFMSPYEMKNVVEKITHHKNEKIILTDRGTFFGYNNLVSDITAIPIMKKFGFPVGFDATHSVQQPASLGKTSGGKREFIQILAKAAIVAGCNVLYLESHHDPKNAKSDSSTVIDFNILENFITEIEKLYTLVNSLNA